MLEFISIFETQFEAELGIRVVGLDSLLISLPIYSNWLNGRVKDAVPYELRVGPDEAWMVGDDLEFGIRGAQHLRRMD